MSWKKLFSCLYEVILWFISVLVLARTGLVFAPDRVHGLDVTLSHLMSLTGVERRGSFLSSDWCRQSHQALSVLGEFRSKLFFSCTLHHQYCCCYCSSKLFLSQSMFFIFCDSTSPLQPPCRGREKWGSEQVAHHALVAGESQWDH